MARKLSDIEKLIETVNGLKKDVEFITKKEFEDNFGTLLNFVKEIKSRNSQEMTGIKDLSGKELQAIKTALSREVESLRQQVNNAVRDVKDGYTPIKDIDYFDGRDADEEAIVQRLKQQIPQLPDLSGQSLIAKINEDDSESKINRDKIEGLDDFGKDLVKTARQGMGSGGGKTGLDFITEIDISDDLDGSTKTFNIQAVYKIITVDLSSFPNALRKNTDYTYTPTTITFTSEIDAATSLASGQTCIITAVTA